MAIEETSSLEEQPTQVRVRRAAVAAGVGLVWASFLAAIGFVLFGALALLAAAAVAVWALQPRLPRFDLRPTAGRAARSTSAHAGTALRALSVGLARARTGSVAATRTAADVGHGFSVAAGHASRIGAARAASLSRSAGGRTVVAARRLSNDAREATRTGINTAVPAVRAAADRAATTAATTKRRLERPATTEAPSLARESTYLRRQGRVDEAVQAAAAAVAEFDNAGDARGRALAANSLGIALAEAGRHAEAIDAFDTALAVLAEVGDRHHEGQVLANLGSVHRRVGGDEAARFCWSKALERLEPGTPESERTAELLGVR
jgi:tetratricopeptide (TPR) repeat protein